MGLGLGGANDGCSAHGCPALCMGCLQLDHILMLVGVLISAPNGLSCEWLEALASQSLGHLRDHVVGALKALPGCGLSVIGGGG